MDTFACAFAAPLEPSRSTWLVLPDLDRATARQISFLTFVLISQTKPVSQLSFKKIGAQIAKSKQTP